MSTAISSSYNVKAWVKNSYATGSRSQTLAAWLSTTKTNKLWAWDAPSKI